jgi:hypothetical protein
MGSGGRAAHRGQFDAADAISAISINPNWCNQEEEPTLGTMVDMMVDTMSQPDSWSVNHSPESTIQATSCVVETSPTRRDEPLPVAYGNTCCCTIHDQFLFHLDILQNSQFPVAA